VLDVEVPLESRVGEHSTDLGWMAQRYSCIPPYQHRTSHHKTEWMVPNVKSFAMKVQRFRSPLLSHFPSVPIRLLPLS
jgi:hypothetical protein